MKILFSLTYYYPHISGLTIYAQRLAEALVGRGHSVTVLTSQHDNTLTREDMHEGVRVVRVPVSFRISKGPVMASYVSTARRLLREHDLVFLSLPSTPIECLTMAMCRLVFRHPVCAVYQCDLKLPPGLANKAIEKALFLVNLVTGACLDRIIVLTEDYANHSTFMRRFRRKREIIAPAVIMPAPTIDSVAEFRRTISSDAHYLIGFAGRFAAEKGVEYLLAAFELILEKLPRARLVFTVFPEQVVGEQEYWKRLQPLLARLQDRCKFLGTLSHEELALFYAACDVTVLSSINSTEAFGLVQLESMLCGTPVVATDLPGVRVPILKTGMGRLIPPRDPQALADALIEVVTNRQNYIKPPAEIENHFSFRRMVDDYEEFFQRLI